MKINKIKGTLDFFSDDAKDYRFIEQIVKEISSLFGYQEMIIPIFEATEVFARSVGESSDIVNKEMYTFLDRGNRSITLRPEGTAGITRSFVENKLYVEPGLTKISYFGPMFRYERPQAGRLRQFTQFGVEAFGVETPYLDADIINLNYQVLKALRILKIKVLVNTIGGEEARRAYGIALQSHFSSSLVTLCQDCQKRYHTNPLRMLDCKVDYELQVMKDAPKIWDFLAEKDRRYFNEVLKSLELLNIPFEVNDRLVRGLDYYTNTVFEIVYDDNQSSINNLALSAGGRYNSLTKDFDGPATPAIGFAMGIERLLMVRKELGVNNHLDEDNRIVVLTLGDTMKIEGLRLANFLRMHGLAAELDYQNHHLKPQFKLATRFKARYLIIIGEDEKRKNCVKLKDTILGTEEEMSLEDLNKVFNIEGEAYAYL